MAYEILSNILVEGTVDSSGFLISGVPINSGGVVSFGNSAGTYAEGNDSRLTDSRTPTAHASSHITGDVIQSATASQKGLATSTQITKLDGIEALADVTDATNVESAGAVMTTATSISGWGWVLDEDNMASNSSTKVCTQQSILSYVNSISGGPIYSLEIKHFGDV